MNIVVCIKQVPAKDAPLRVDANAAWVHESGTQYDTNEADMYALEEALKFADIEGGEVVLLSIGPERVEQCLREGLAKGADRAIHIFDENPHRDPLEVASLLASIIKTLQYDLILTGLQSDDAGYAQTGVMLAQLLDLPHASIVKNISLESGELNVTREIGGGLLQDVQLTVPALLTLQAGINKPRYAGIKGIMAAKRKEIQRILSSEITQINCSGSHNISAVYYPPQQKETLYLDGQPRDIALQLVTSLQPFLSKV